MDKIDEQLNNISAVEIPSEMHQTIMWKVSQQKIQPVLFFAFILFVLNFLVIAWRINSRLIDADFLDMTRDFLDVFSFNFSFISIMFQNFFEIISPAFVLSTILSFAGAVYVGKKMNMYRLSKI